LQAIAKENLYYAIGVPSAANQFHFAARISTNYNLGEGVTDTISRPLNAFQDTGLNSGSKSYLGGMTLDERGMVQILHLKVLLEQINPLHNPIGLGQ
jgi:hypothetical protein